MSESSAAILAPSGATLSADERRFFEAVRPWGFILFDRNLSGAAQISDLIAELRDCVGRPSAPVFIDQEGGKVQRLWPPLAAVYPSAATLGALYRRDEETGKRATWLMSRLHAFDLARYGINANCLPVLDVPVAGAHNVIGSRAYAEDPATVATLARKAAEGLLAGGVLPVVKHVPGHGRAGADSHLALPRVAASRAELESSDFLPFKQMADMPMAMTAHVVYEAIDASRPATVSPMVVSEVIRGHIGFDGLLMTDDLSMKALSGDFAERTRASLAAGCDVVLHCNGDMDEMRAIAAVLPPLSGDAARRAVRAMDMIDPEGTDLGASEAVLRGEFGRMFELEA